MIESWLAWRLPSHSIGSLVIGAKSTLISVGDVEEAVGVAPLLVDLRHQGVTLEDVSAVHEKVEGVLLGKSDSLSDDEAELVGC